MSCVRIPDWTGQQDKLEATSKVKKADSNLEGGEIQGNGL